MSDEPTDRRAAVSDRRRLAYRVGAAGSGLVAAINVTQADWVGVGLFLALAVSFLIGASRRRT